MQKTSATDLQTKADRLVQMSICSSLARKFPKLTIIGEEDLPPGEVDQELIEDGQWEEILKQPCPSQYSAIKEEDVRSICVLCALLVRGCCHWEANTVCP